MSEEPGIEELHLIESQEGLRTELPAVVQGLVSGSCCRFSHLETSQWETTEEFLQQFSGQHAAVILLETQTSQKTGRNFLNEFKAREWRYPVIVMNSSDDFRSAVEFMKQGAFDYLKTPVQSSELVQSIQEAFVVARQWWEESREFRRLSEALAQLTAPEQETLELIREGHYNKTIARKFEISERAVEMRRSKIMKKLGVRSIAELMSIIVEYQCLKRELQHS